jgi:hypothetical protein
VSVGRAHRRRRARGRARGRGFTVAELIVGLAAGLLVASALVGLSREATTTFHEEAHVATAESAVRLGLARLRADLQRAGAMGTGNVRFDPWMARPLNGPSIPADHPLGIRRLAGIRYLPGGSTSATPLSAAQTPPLRPDAIEIGGNLTSTDAYDAERIGAKGTSACGGQRILLTRDTPSLQRVVGAAVARGDASRADALLAAIFQPVPGTPFMVRVVDAGGRAQLARTCSATAAGYASGAPFVDLDPSTPIRRVQTGFLGGYTGFGRVAVNPVQVVRWEIMPVDGPGYAALNPRNDPGHYDLVRRWLSADGEPAGAPEVVAELAVDLKLAFTVDARAPEDEAPKLQRFAEGAPENALWGADVTTQARSVPGPQRIRSVRIRLSTRAEVPDRKEPLAAPSIAGGGDLALRYCTLLTGCTSGRAEWARVRTLTEEVTLPNQTGMLY